MTLKEELLYEETIIKMAYRNPAHIYRDRNNLHDGLYSPIWKTTWQVVEVNLFRETVVLDEHDQEVLFLTDHDWTGDELLKLGCRETDRMGTVGYFTAPDGTKFHVNDMNEWCIFFRLHTIEGITLEQLGLHP